MNELFRKFSSKTSELVGSSWAFILAVLIVVVWAVTGPMFDYSANWQLVINTGTTIITFLMIFLVQNTQNRDAKAIHLKLDELIKATQGASDKLLDLDALSDKQMKELEKEYKRICTGGENPEDCEAPPALEKGGENTGQRAGDDAQKDGREGGKEAVEQRA